MAAKGFLCTDAGGTPRGECKACHKCKSWQLQRCCEVRFKREGSALRNAGAGADARCEGCGCPAHQHQNIQPWLDKARDWVRRMLKADLTWPEHVPAAFSVPVAAKDWEPVACALHIVTNGQFDPSRDGRIAAGQKAAPSLGGLERPLVSVICTTLEKHHPTHPLLYECFRRQGYERSELIVIDSGTLPSTFLQERAKEDPRLVYRFYFREEHGLEQEEDPLEHVLKADDPFDVVKWVPWRPDMDRAEVKWHGFSLSLGLKRNIACYLARGDTIVHFNAGDLYGSSYLQSMQHELASGGGGAAASASAVAFTGWHGVDLSCLSFRQLDVQAAGYELTTERRQQIEFAHGFTFGYSRSAWEKAAWVDEDEPEFTFLKALAREKVTFRVVEPAGISAGLAAHAYDKEQASGATAMASVNLSGEINALVEYSRWVPVPMAFAPLLPTVRTVVEVMNRHKEDGLDAMLRAEGAMFFCNNCSAAVALNKYLKEVKSLADGTGGQVEIAQFSRAGGAVAEGEEHYEAPPTTRSRPVVTVAGPSGGGGLLGRSGLGLSSMQRPLGGSVTRRPGVPITQGLGAALAGRSSVLPGRSPAVLGQGFGQLQRRPLIQKQAPEPQETVWFPGWSRRFALCRRCGSHIGWRYERWRGDKDMTIFWALEKGLLRKQDPPALEYAPPKRVVAPSPAVPIAVAAEPKEKELRVAPDGHLYTEEEFVQFYGGLREWNAAKALKPSLRPEVEAGGASEAPAPKPPVEPKIDAVPERQSPVEVTPPKVATSSTQESFTGQKPKTAAAPAAAEEAPADKGLQAVSSFSIELLEALATGIVAPQQGSKPSFDATLNALKMDEGTRSKLMLELKIRPGVPPTQAEQLVAKSFKGKVNVLRCLGMRAICVAVEKALPAGALQRLGVDFKSLLPEGKPAGRKEASEKAAAGSTPKGDLGDKQQGKVPGPAEPAVETRKAAPKAEEAVSVAPEAAAPGCEALTSFSLHLLEVLATSLSSNDKTKFDAALNALKMDDATRASLLESLRIRPGVPASQVEQLVAKSFKKKVNMLRSLGLRALQIALEKALPEESVTRLGLKRPEGLEGAKRSHGREDGNSSTRGSVDQDAPIASPPAGPPAAAEPQAAAAPSCRRAEAPKEEAEAGDQDGGGGSRQFDFDLLDRLEEVQMLAVEAR